MQPVSTSARARAWASAADFLGAAAVLAVLLVPALTASARPGDWYQHFWYIWHQSTSLRLNHAPSLFAHDDLAVFDPHYAFYGGTLYVLAGLLALLLGSTQAALGTSLVLAVASAYGGWWWLARLAGLSHFAAHLPAVLFVASPTYLNVIYRTGSWPELVAVSAIPLLLASAISILQADRLRAGPTLALGVSVVLFTGSHNITLLWGTTTLVVAAVMIAATVPPARGLITRSGVLRIAAIALPAALVNAWFLLPDVAYQGLTNIAQRSMFEQTLIATASMTDARFLFALDRPASPPSAYVLTLPVVAVAWVLVGLVLGWPRRRSGWFRAAVAFLFLSALLTWLVANAQAITNLPWPLPAIQFGFRIEAYVLLCLSGATLAALAAVAPSARMRGWRWAGVAVTLLAIIQGWGQIHQHHTRSVQTGDATRPAYHTGQARQQATRYDYGIAQLAPPLPGAQKAKFPTTAERGNHVSLTVEALPGQLLTTNLVVMSPLLTIRGARFLGRNPNGVAILELTADQVWGGDVTVTVSPAKPWPVRVGNYLSLFGLAGLAAVAAWIGVAAWRRRFRPAPS